MSETLVVISKVKKMIKDKGMNTSASAIDALSILIERLCVKAIANAEKAKRKTVMDRDFEMCCEESCKESCDSDCACE